MKKNVLKTYSLLFMLCSFSFCYADPSDPDGSGDELPVPINKKLIFLAVLGVSLAFYIINKKIKQKSIS